LAKEQVTNKAIRMARMKHIPFPSQLDYFEEGTEKIIFFREKCYWPETKMYFFFFFLLFDSTVVRENATKLKQVYFK
jgi:hypothetical protein